MTPGHNKVGAFTISTEMLRELPMSIVNKIFKDIIVVRAEMLLHKNAIEYIANGEPFDEIGIREQVPEYEIMIHEFFPSGNALFLKKQIKIEWKRK